MDKENAIKIEGLHKTFKLPHEKQSSIKGAIVNLGRSQKGYETQQVLKNINFEIKKGDFFGIVGRNGSGKSTLLKLIAGIYSADSGTVQVNGSLTPFIELGVGFNPELTGRENVFLNGALLGFSRKEMLKMYDSIVEFAELERFMDQKLKNYSSGMQVRLAFSIAIQAKSDILVLDEVLAVGDEAFQKKCTNVFEKYKANKQTIVLVTHDMGVVEKFCNRAIMIEDGKIIEEGTPGSIARLYSEHNKESYAASKQLQEEKKPYTGNFKLQTLDAVTSKPKKRFQHNEKMRIRLSWQRQGIQNVGVAIMKQSGEYIYGPNTYRDKIKLKKGKNSLDYIVDLNIGPGDYYLKAGLFGSTDSEVLEFIDEGPSFIIETKKPLGWGGVTELQHGWES